MHSPWSRLLWKRFWGGKCSVTAPPISIAGNMDQSLKTECLIEVEHVRSRCETDVGWASTISAREVEGHHCLCDDLVEAAEGGGQQQGPE
jgi:hypothetical protein